MTEKLPPLVSRYKQLRTSTSLSSVHTMTHITDRLIPLLLASCVRALLKTRADEQAPGLPESDPGTTSGGSGRTMTLPITIPSTPEWSDAELADIMTVLALGHSLPHSASPFSWVPRARSLVAAAARCPLHPRAWMALPDRYRCRACAQTLAYRDAARHFRYR